MIDNPISWFILCIAGLYLIYRFIWSAIQENEYLKEERKKATERLFSNKALDKYETLWYNKSSK